MLIICSIVVPDMFSRQTSKKSIEKFLVGAYADLCTLRARARRLAGAPLVPQYTSNVAPIYPQAPKKIPPKTPKE